MTSDANGYDFLLNGASIVVGGGIQSCTAFVRYLIARGISERCFFVVSDEIHQELLKFGVDIASMGGVVTIDAPSKHLATRRLLADVERKCKPAVVFTFFGPSYVKFRAKHICGVADGWVTHSTPLAFKTLRGWSAKLRMLAALIYKAFHFRRADYWIVEHDCAKQGLIRRLRLAPGKISVVPNNCAPHYVASTERTVLLEETAKCRILVFGAYYPNKRLEIIPLVAKALRSLDQEFSFEFIITVKPGLPICDELATSLKRIGLNHSFKNIGPIPLRDGPALYRSCDVVFHPSVLETFSAVYPEAMAMAVPIVTSDLDFARSICGEGALYFNPNDPGDAAKKIHEVHTNVNARKRLIERARKRQSDMPTIDQNHKSLVDIISGIVDRHS